MEFSAYVLHILSFLIFQCYIFAVINNLFFPLTVSPFAQKYYLRTWKKENNNKNKKYQKDSLIGISAVAILLFL